MAFRAVKTATGNSTAPSVALPTSVINDYLIWVACTNDATAGMTIPSGFARLFPQQNLTLDGEAFIAGWKRVGAAEAGPYAGTTPVSIEWTCFALTFSGRSPIRPPGVGTSTLNNSGNSSPITCTAPGVTADALDDILAIFCGDTTSLNGGNGWSQPTGFTERADVENAANNMSVHTKDDVTAGGTGDVVSTFTLSAGTSGWGAVLVRLPTDVLSSDARANQYPTVYRGLIP